MYVYCSKTTLYRWETESDLKEVNRSCSNAKTNIMIFVVMYE